MLKPHFRKRGIPTFVRVVGLDMPDVVPGEFVDGLLDLGQAALLAHPLRREVGVRARPPPLALQNMRNTFEGLGFAIETEFNKMTKKSKIGKYMKHAEHSIEEALLTFRITYRLRPVVAYGLF